ncbi:fatty acyl-CoA reductase wat-like [Neodiprion virginianus]|uniref:fatty acyl-CoA reductase wat-like n=1 Tax=Neodiprion fabricii TaxID=2872261 RepID=UPI001ED8F543|nr:fatty acyl-CoA reductase wat-like [Neodiprion fabricii]XP_046424477.1 fatty acyl-CoA reductase wat-like [Neodiprion fabricii]XP_046424478.1 fatty acyl-CoA reductase wat-like [Neodiprion fabricii]XP_046424479.1 fatty acyl-CoA reductase wat-like [Neodiprion fabricii]XP_046616789.1 fatty acyl-CoA reductase wat-like [Neodiprion virginianus]XP_046616790.1 fatty acyl-CoA reductase wat-like [Neodiprion virginianus]XP_046616791.1 fatty acyl-CoA reductase wat-like [Neodiprion virginianus]XP_046616
MVEVLMESGGQEVVVADSCGSTPDTPADFPSKPVEMSVPPTKLTTLQEFYTGQSIFVTGGTGFLGKLLIDKLLRKCPGIVSIYLLVRAKKGKDVHQRAEEIFDDPLFERLKEEVPKFRHQIVPVAGDCNAPGLGLTPVDRSTITREVSVVFHGAATVRFDEKLKLAVAINVQAPKDILELCKEMPKLKSILHVSTAYANCPQEQIDEKFYDPPIEYKKILTLVDCVNEKFLDEITPELLGKWPNTYAYTKAIAEHVIREEAGDLPVGMFRPAIVISTYQEPIRGWIDNMYGPTGVAAGAGTGLLRSLHCNGSIQANVVPGDMTVNAMIAAAWDVAEMKRKNKNGSEIPIYNYCSRDNPITWDDLKEMSEKYGIAFPSIKAMWYYSFRNTKSKVFHLFLVYVLHLLPALVIDTATICVGKEPRLLKIYKKIHKFMTVLNYFTTHEWKFSTEMVNKLHGKLEPEDRKIFFFDIKSIVWDTYFQTYMKGIRIYLIKDPLDTLRQARIRWQKLYWIHQGFKLLLAYVFLRVSWLTVSTVLSVVA